MLSGEELLAGGTLDFEVEIPSDILHAAGQQQADTDVSNSVRMRPLTVHHLQLISRAAKESDSLMATLMVQRALVDPQMSVAQVNAMHIGLVQYLLKQVNEISGIAASQEQINQAVDEPLTKAAFVLAKEFGWTPQQVNELTLGQVLLNLKMLSGKHDFEARQ